MKINNFIKLNEVVYIAKKDEFESEYEISLKSNQNVNLNIICSFASYGKELKWVTRKIYVKDKKVSKKFSKEIRDFLHEDNNKIIQTMNYERDKVLDEQRKFEKVSIERVSIENRSVNQLRLWKFNFFLLPEKKFCNAFIQLNEENGDEKFSVVEKNNSKLNWDSNKWYAGWKEELKQILQDSNNQFESSVFN